MSPALRGVLWMSATVLSFCAMAVASRELLRGFGVMEIVLFRTAVQLALVVAVAWHAGAAGLRTRHLGVHLWRNLFQIGGQVAWVYAIGALPLAMVFAIEFTMPIWTALMAVLLLGERMNRGRAAMLALGFAGVLLILRPGFAVVQPAALVMLAGSLCFAVQMIGTKRLSATDSPLAVLFWMSVIQVPISIALAVPGWVTPGLADLPWIAVLGGTSCSAHYCLTRAMRAADATLIAPVDFFRLPLIAVVGFLFYAEPFDPAVLAGAAVIFAGTWFSLSRESRRV